jgi:hypothetical protein
VGSLRNHSPEPLNLLFHIKNPWNRLPNWLATTSYNGFGYGVQVQLGVYLGICGADLWSVMGVGSSHPRQAQTFCRFLCLLATSAEGECSCVYSFDCVELGGNMPLEAAFE